MCGEGLEAIASIRMSLHTIDEQCVVKERGGKGEGGRERGREREREGGREGGRDRPDWEQQTNSIIRNSWIVAQRDSSHVQGFSCVI
jgi:hypothetical protein